MADAPDHDQELWVRTDGCSDVADGTGRHRRLTGLEPLSSGVLLTLSILIAAGFLVSAVRQTIPTTAMTDVENPVVLDSVVMKSGEDLYFANCAVCHGPAGRGLEVVDPLHNHGNAADLTDQRSILLSDGDLFYRISEGVLNSEMPAYDQALTEEERWALVHYLRVLQGQETIALMCIDGLNTSKAGRCRPALSQ